MSAAVVEGGATDSNWFAPTVAFGLGVLLVLGFVLVRFSGTPRATRPAPAVTTVAPSWQPSPGAVCASRIEDPASLGSPRNITAIRAGSDASRDRFVVEFAGSGPPPTIELKRQDSSTFTQDASGRHVTLAGKAGWLLIIRGADEHTAYSGANDFVTGYPVLAEARNIGDFEGTVSWALGVNTTTSCPAVSTLSGPSRIVIDFPR